MYAALGFGVPLVVVSVVAGADSPVDSPVVFFCLFLLPSFFLLLLLLVGCCFLTFAFYPHPTSVKVGDLPVCTKERNRGREETDCGMNPEKKTSRGMNPEKKPSRSLSLDFSALFGLATAFFPLGLAGHTVFRYMVFVKEARPKVVKGNAGESLDVLMLLLLQCCCCYVSYSGQSLFYFLLRTK